MWRPRLMRIRPTIPHKHRYGIITAFQWEYKCTLRIVGQLAFRAEQPLFRPRTFYLGSREIEVVIFSQLVRFEVSMK